MSDPVARATFEAIVARLEAADATNRLLLDNHIAEYRREFADMKADVRLINTKIDTVITNQERWKGRDGMIAVLITALVSISCTVIAAAILGVIS